MMENVNLQLQRCCCNWLIVGAHLLSYGMPSCIVCNPHLFVLSLNTDSSLLLTTCDPNPQLKMSLFSSTCHLMTSV
jgi:hypothetical protein